MTTGTDAMTETPEHGAPDHGVFAPRRAPATTPRRRWTAVVPWVVAVVALAVAAISTVQWQRLAAHDAQVNSARAAAVGFAQLLTTWDAGNGLDDEVAALRARGTGPFLDELDLVFGGDELSSQLEADEVSATGEVQEAFVQDLEGDTAEAFVVVSVTYRAPTIQEDPAPVTFPASLTLERASDGTWLVREVLLPNSDQIGRLMAPTTGE